MHRPVLLAIAAAGLMALVLSVPGPAPAADPMIGATAEAVLQPEGKKLYLATSSRSYQLAQYAYGRRVGTIVVDGEVRRRLRISDDIGAESQPTGTVALAIHPITASGQFGALAASRELPGDEIRLDSPAGVAVIAYGCCAESSSETELSLDSLKTLYVLTSGIKLLTYTILGKPARGRVIALYLPMTPSDDEVLGSDPTSVGLITVAGEGEVLQRIRVHLHADHPREAAFDWSYEHGWQNPSGSLDEHTVIDPVKPTKPVFEWRVGDHQTIALPLVSDRLAAEAAQLPARVTLEPLSQ